MIVDNFTNPFVIITLFFISVVFYGIHLCFSRYENISKKHLLLTAFGCFFAVVNLLTTVVQNKSFVKMSSGYQQNNSQVYEASAINASIDVDLRIEAASKTYINTGKSIAYLGEDKKISSYQITDADRLKRNEKIQNDKLFNEVVARNLGLHKMIFFIYFVFFFSLPFFIYYKYVSAKAKE